MKRVFRALTFVAIMTVTPVTFTSCGDLVGMLEDLLEEIEKEEGDDGDYGYNDDYNNNTGDKNDNGNEVPPLINESEKGEAEVIEIPQSGIENVNFLERCVNLTHEYKYTIIGLEDCYWVRVVWVENYNENRWTPLLTVDENTTGEGRSVNISIMLGENCVCNHLIYQYN